MKKTLTAQDYFQGIRDKKLSYLSRAITLVESKNDRHREIARELIELILPFTGSAKRIGISGTPGVGKSTFLENFGMFLIEQNFKIAVLAIDPTSQITGGSILGDKTRMQYLSGSNDAFIRPSPAGATLGGVAAKTREAMLLCDAFGFDYIFVETVGVGQSEVTVSHMVDFFLLLMQPGSGDELQGIKRGILEVSDLVIVNKSDGDFEKSSKIAQHDYQKSLDVLQEKREWQTSVVRCSSIYKKGFDKVQEQIQNFYDNVDIQQKRKEQTTSWIAELVKDRFLADFAKIDLSDEIDKILSGKTDVIRTVDKIYQDIGIKK